MSPDKPNKLHLCGEYTMAAPFGTVHSVTAINLPGLGHDPHLHLRFKFGVSVDLSPADAAELSRRIPEELAKLPIWPPIHDAYLDEEEA